MTVKIDLLEIHKIIKMFTERDGWANTKRVLEATAKLYGCKPQTIRFFIYRNDDTFDIEFGRIRLKPVEISTVKEQDNETEIFEKWLQPKMKLVDECTEFLKKVEGMPEVETMLISISNARENLYNYDDSKLKSFVMELKKTFGFVPVNKIED